MSHLSDVPLRDAVNTLSEALLQRAAFMLCSCLLCHFHSGLDFFLVILSLKELNRARGCRQHGCPQSFLLSAGACCSLRTKTDILYLFCLIRIKPKSASFSLMSLDVGTCGLS